MEASQAAQTGQAQGQGEGGAANQGEALDATQLAQQFEQMTTGQQELLEILRSQPWQAQQQEPAQDADPVPGGELDLSFLDDTSPSYDPQAVAERLQQVISQGIEQGIQQRVAPIVGDITTRMDAAELVGEFPELGDENTAREVVGLAREMAQALGMPELADKPKFWRYAYMVGRAAEQANQEGAESPGAAHLEGGGGAAPSAPQVDPGDLIVGPRKGGRSVLPF